MGKSIWYNFRNKFGIFGPSLRGKNKIALRFSWNMIILIVVMIIWRFMTEIQQIPQNWDDTVDSNYQKIYFHLDLHSSSCFTRIASCQKKDFIWTFQLLLVRYGWKKIYKKRRYMKENRTEWFFNVN